MTPHWLLVPFLQAAGYEGKVKIGMDVAASEFMTEDGKYDLDFKNKPNDGSQVKTGCASPVFDMLSDGCGVIKKVLKQVSRF